METAAKPTAACEGHDPEMWFPLPHDPITEAYAVGVCADCPLRVGCRDFAREHGIRFGIWGGINLEVR